jgi:hypothetical protein
LAKTNPRASCDLLRSAFDRILAERVASRGDEGNVRLHSFYGALDTLRGRTIVETLKATSVGAAGYFLEMMIPWLERVVRYSAPLDNEPFFFASDPLSGVWLKTPFIVQPQLNQAFITSLTGLARTS